MFAARWASAYDLDMGRREGIEPGLRVVIGWDGEDLIAFALGQELMLALRHAVSCPQKVIWAYGQRGVKRHSMWADMGGARRLPSIASTERPFGRRTGWERFRVMPASAPATRTWLEERKGVGWGNRGTGRVDH